MAFGVRLFLCVLNLFASLAIMSSARNILPLSGNRNLLGVEMEGRSLKVGIDDSGSSIRSNSQVVVLDYSEPKPNPSHDPLVPPAAAKDDEMAVLDYSEPKLNPGHEPWIPSPATSTQFGIN